MNDILNDVACPPVVVSTHVNLHTSLCCGCTFRDISSYVIYFSFKLNASNIFARSAEFCDSSNLVLHVENRSIELSNICKDRTATLTTSIFTAVVSLRLCSYASTVCVVRYSQKENELNTLQLLQVRQFLQTLIFAN